MPFPSKANTPGPFAWTLLTEPASRPRATIMIQTMRFHLAQEEDAMGKAQHELAAGNCDLALVFAYHAGACHAHYQQTAEQLAHLGVDSTTVLFDRGPTQAH